MQGLTPKQQYRTDVDNGKPRAVDYLLRQEQEWNAGSRSSIEQILAEQPELLRSRELLLDLIENEIIVRTNCGDRPELEEYQRRFPGIADDIHVQWLVNDLCLNEHVPRRNLALHLIGRYEVNSLLGHGGIGVVYRAWDPLLKRSVAIKVLKSGRHADAHDLTRFRLEAEAIARVHHRNVVQVFDVGDSEGEPFIAMEYCEGVTLANRLKGMPISPRETAEIVREVASGIAAAHEVQVVHRDLKPANIFLCLPAADRPQAYPNLTTDVGKPAICHPNAPTSVGNGLVPKVCDFGLAKLLDADDCQTRSGALLGTPPYMAPEQALGIAEQIGTATDVYSLGAILYECLAGRPPFHGATPAATLEQVRTVDPIPIRRFEPRTPLDLEMIALQCLEKEPAHRYANALAVAEDLGRFLEGRPVNARRTGKSDRFRRWCLRNPRIAMMLMCIGLLLILITAGSSIAAIWLKQERDAARVAEKRAVSSEQVQRQNLYRAYILEGKHSRVADQESQFEVGLGAIRKILTTIPFDELTDLQRNELRDEALASLIGISFRSGGHFPFTTRASFDVDLDVDFQQVAGTDRHLETVVVPVEFCISNPQETAPDDYLAGRRIRQFSPDGHWLVDQQFSVAPDNSATTRIRTWNVETREWVSEQQIPFTTSASAMDNKGRLFVPAADDAIHVLRLQDGTEERVSPPRFDSAKLAVDPNGIQCAIITSTPPVEIVETSTWMTTASIPDAGHASAVAWDPTDRLVVFGAYDGGLYLWYSGPGTGHSLTREHHAAINILRFSPDGRLLASSDENNKLVIRSLWGDQILFRGTGRPIRFSRDGRRLAIASADKIEICEVLADHPYSLIHVPAEGCMFSPDGHWLFTGGFEGVRVFDPVDMRSDAPSLGLDPCGPPAVHPSGVQVVTYGTFSKLWRWPLATKANFRQIGPATKIELTGLSGLSSIEPQRQHCMAAWTSDGNRLVASDFRNQRVLLFDDQGRAPPRVLGELLNVLRIAISPNGKWVAGAAHIYPKCVVWSVDEGRAVLEIADGQEIAFSPDGRWLAVSTGRGIRLLQVGTWELVREWSREDTGSRASPVVFQPGGTLLVYSSAYGVIRLCDVTTGAVVGNVTEPVKHHFSAFAFSPDGTRLACTGQSGFDVCVLDLHELRNGLLALGIPAAGFPIRSSRMTSGKQELGVIRGTELPAVEQWTRNWLELAEHEIDDGNPADAVQNVTQALAELRADVPLEERAMLLTWRGVYQVLNNNWIAARDDWQQALRIQPNSGPPLQHLARLYLLGPKKLRNASSAMSILAPVLLTRDSDEEIASLMGVAQCQLGLWEVAAKALQQVKGRHRVLASYYLAISLHRIGRSQEAEQAFNEAQTSEPLPAGTRFSHEAIDLAVARKEASELLGKWPRTN